MSSCKDMSGLRFGRLTVISRAENSRRGDARWNCVCDCGNKTVVDGRRLRNGGTKSCGCLWKEKIVEGSIRYNKKENEYREVGSVVYVKLANSDKEMIVDADMWKNWARQYRWRLGRDGYAYTTTRQEGYIIFHIRAFPNCPSGMLRDHIDGNRLNNTRSNIRFVTPSQNMYNRKTSDKNKCGQNGVYFHKETGRWAAEIATEHKKVHLGLFSDKNEAIKTRKLAEKELFGEYRRYK